MNFAKAPSILLIICLTGLPQISETIYTPALPAITTALMTTSYLVQWTLSIYFIGFALGVVTWGNVSDHIGRRKAMLWGIVVYTFGCLSCLFAQSIEWLLFSRLLQAFGASAGSVVTQTMMRDVFSDKHRHKMFNIVGMALALAPALGPFIGGYVVEFCRWRANFAVLFLMGASLFLYSFFALPETHDYANAQGATHNLLSVAKLILCDKQVWGSACLVGIFNGIVFSYYAEAPFIFIHTLHFTPSQYGLLGILIASASLMGCILSHRLNNNWSVEKIILTGCLLTFLSMLSFSFMTATGIINAARMTLSLFGILTPMLFFYLSFGLVIPNVLSKALVNYKDILGTAGSVFGLTYYFLVAGCTFLMGVLHNGTLFPMPYYFLTLSVLMLFAYFLSAAPKLRLGRRSLQIPTRARFLLLPKRRT